jgi:hypothetical protein
MGLHFFLFHTTAPQMLYTNLCSLGILQRQRREPERKRGMILDLHIKTSAGPLDCADNDCGLPLSIPQWYADLGKRH